MVDGAGHDGASDMGMGHGGHADLGMGHGHGGHDFGGHDFGHGPSAGFSGFSHGHSHGFGYGFHMFDGHGHGGHVTTEALMVSHSHCHSGGNMHVSSHVSNGHFDHGSIDPIDGVDWVAERRQQEEKLRAYKQAIEKAKADPMRRYYGAHVLGHGYVDVQKLFANIAQRLGAHRFCNRVGNFSPVDLMPIGITDWDKYAPPFSRRRPPAGWYPGADGVTHVFKQYWQVARPVPWWWPVKPPSGFDRKENTYFEISLVTWFYGGVGDYETRLDINVVSIPVLDQFDKSWGYRGTPLSRHQKAAEGICKEIFAALKAAAPPDYVRARRDKVMKMIEDLARKEREGSGKPGNSLPPGTGKGKVPANPGSTPGTGGQTGSGSGSEAGSGKAGDKGKQFPTNPPTGSGTDLDSVLTGDPVDDGVGTGTEPQVPEPTGGDAADAALPDGGQVGSPLGAPAQDPPPAPDANTVAEGTKVTATAVIPTPRYRGR